MGISEKYREFRTREGYEQFFQEVRANKQNWIMMYAPEEHNGKRRVLSRTYVPNPDIDFKVNDFILNGDRFKGRWKIMPVANLPEYRENTDKRSYRVALRRQQVMDYRRFMTKEGIFMPLLVFDAQKEIWLSGRHRSEAGKSVFDAFFSVVLTDLTPEDELFVTDIANQWHQESWTEDERALIALEYVRQKKLDKKQALLHVGLDPNDEDPLLGAQLYRKWKQSPTNRPLLESGVGGHGRPYSLKQWGARIRPFGLEAIKSYKLERWLFLKEEECRLALGLIRSRTNSTLRGDYYSQLFVKAGFDMEQWALKGNPEQRWKQFMNLIRIIRQTNMDKTARVYAPSDDKVFMNFIARFEVMSDAGLTRVKGELTKPQRTQVRNIVEKLHRIFVV